MPLSHRRLSGWYHVLAQQLEVGLPFADAVRCARGAGMPATVLETMAVSVETGGSAAAAFAAAERWLPLSDRKVLMAAAETGRVPAVLQRLSARHAELGAAKRKLKLACAYPLVVLHVGLLLLPVIRMIDWEKGFLWDAGSYVRGVASFVLPLWAAICVVAWLAARGNAAVMAGARVLPYLAGYVRTQGLSDLAFVLGNFLEAGMRIDRAWAAAGDVATRADLRKAAGSIEGVIARGGRVGARLSAWNCFPPDFVALYHSGEMTGQLDQNLQRFASQQQAAANHALTQATIFYPAVAFVLVAGAVAYAVVKIYAGYLEMLQRAAS